MTPALADWGSASLPMKGQIQSGDRAVSVPFQDGFLAGVIDGLGHGTEAASVAVEVATLLEARPGDLLETLFRSCHESTLKTRGSVMSLASFNGSNHTVTWAGVGNVEGLLVRADNQAVPSREHLILSAGGVGFQFPKVRASVLSLSPGDTLIFASDGVDPSFGAGLRLGKAPGDMAHDILGGYNRGIDDAMVLVVRYRGAGNCIR